MENSVTDILTAQTLVSAASNLILEGRLERAARRDTLHAAIEERGTAATTGDIAAAWLAAGLVGLTLLALGGPP